MAIVYLNPASSTTNTNWDESNVGYLAQGEISNKWVTTATPSALVTTLSDFDNTGVASIDSVQIILVGRSDNRSAAITAKTDILDSSDSLLYENDFVVIPHKFHQTYSGTVHTTSDGSAAWTDGDLDGMKIRIDVTDGSTYGQMQQFYIKVIYTETTGYGNTVNGVAAANIGKINGVATANINKVNGV